MVGGWNKQGIGAEFEQPVSTLMGWQIKNWRGCAIAHVLELIDF